MADWPTPELQRAVEGLGGDIVATLDGGRTPVFRTERGIVRVGSPKRIQVELLGQQNARECFPALTSRMPSTLDQSEFVAGERTLRLLLETDLGPVAADPAEGAADWIEAFASTRVSSESFEGTLLEALGQISPPGQRNPTHLIRGLRALQREGRTLPFPAKQSALARALDAVTLVEFERCCAHGALSVSRVLEGGLCHWRFFGEARRWGEDLAAFGELSEFSPAEALHALKWAWTQDPLRAAHALQRLGVIEGPRPEVTELHLEAAHPGLAQHALEAILGCPLGTVSGVQAERAFGRVKGLVVGGLPIELRADPPVRPRDDPRFRQPRGRDETRLFSRAPSGVRLDHAGTDAGARASLTAEHFAEQQARKLGGGVVVDGFCGAGGNAIAFARRSTCSLVIAVELDAERLELAKENARVYGVTDKIRFVHGDFFDAAEDWVLREVGVMDAVCFIDPPWSEGDAFVRRAWRVAEERYAEGAVKLPRAYPVEPDRTLDVSLTPEGFPSFVTVYWRRRSG